MKGRAEAKKDNTSSSSECETSDSESDSSESGCDSSESDTSEITQTTVIGKTKYHLANEKAISVQNNYICHLCGSESGDKIAIASSDFTSSVISAESFQLIITFEGHKNTITNVRFHPSDPHQLVTSSIDGSIKFWDTRTAGKSVLTFKDDSAESGNLKPFLSFDLSKSGHFLCAGTEVFDGDAFLVFGDARTGKILGGYWESHSDDITQVEFHPLLSDCVASGSSDGLINIYDLKSDTEDDALVNCLNTESTVDKLTWCTMGGTHKGICCILDTMDVQLWVQDGTSPSATFARSDISKSAGWKTSESYLLNVHQTSSNEFLFLAGSSGQGRENLALLKEKNFNLFLDSCLPGNKQRVRCSWHTVKDESLITGGENGILSLWKPSAEFETSSRAPKVLPKMTSPRKSPY